MLLTGSDPVQAVLVGGLLLLVGLLVLALRARFRSAVFQALTGWVYTAIVAGERAMQWGFEDLNARLEGVDKKLVADSIYNLLPAVVVVWHITLPILWIK